MINSINRIIIFFEIPFAEHWYRIFGIDTLIKNNFFVEVWDFSTFLYGEFEQQEVLSVHNTKFKYYRFTNKSEIEDSLSLLTRSDFVNCFIGFSYRTLFIYKILSKKNINYSIPLFNTIPVSNNQKIKKPKKLLSTIKKIVVLKKKIILDHIVNKIIRNHFRVFGIKPATLCIAGGTASMDVNQFPVNVTTHVLWAHSMDYDIFLQNAGKNLSLYPGCAIFLDDFLPFHPDFAMINETAPITPEEYYPKLRTFFSYLECNFGVRIIIASHPRSTYEKLPDYFEGRPIIREETAQLVKECSFVIVHASTSINFAILYQKPIIFLTMDAFKKNEGISKMGEIVENMASLLGKIPHNLDDPLSIDFDKEMEIQINAYEAYKNKYIKKEGSKELEMWQILADYIQEKYS
jgi:hypothetical protein